MFFFRFSSIFLLQLTACFVLAILVVCGDTLVPQKIELITFEGGKNNNFLEEEYFIPKPNPVDNKLKGKTAEGLECFCLEAPGLYLPPVKNMECICDMKCCKERPNNHYLPPVDCVICPKCVCDTTTYTLINKETGNCPSCRYKVKAKSSANFFFNYFFFQTTTEKEM